MTTETKLETTVKAFLYHAEICNFDMGKRSIRTFVDSMKLAISEDQAKRAVNPSDCPRCGFLDT